jgi:hypothetical protein
MLWLTALTDDLQAISKIFGISLFSGPIKPGYASIGHSHPLLMADGNNQVVP